MLECSIFVHYSFVVVFCFYTIIAPPACCLSEVSVPLFPETVTAYDWMTVKNGTTQRQPCPLCCQDLLRYPEGAVVRRECVSAEGGGAQWLSVDFRECLLDVTTLMLCETNKVTLVTYA